MSWQANQGDFQATRTNPSPPSPQQRARFAERQKQLRLADSRGEPHIGAAARDRLKTRDEAN